MPDLFSHRASLVKCALGNARIFGVCIHSSPVITRSVWQFLPRYWQQTTQWTHHTLIPAGETLGIFVLSKSLYCIYQLLQKTFYCKEHTITEFGIIDNKNKNSSTAYVILCELIDTWFLGSNRRVGVWSLPWRWHILSIPLTTGRGTSAETCGLVDVFPPDDLGSRPEAPC